MVPAESREHEPEAFFSWNVNKPDSQLSLKIREAIMWTLIGLSQLKGCPARGEGGYAKPGVTESRFDVIEGNYYLKTNLDVGAQTLFRNWHEDDFYIDAWRSRKITGPVEKVDGEYRMLFMDWDGTMRNIRSEIYNRTFTNDDPEMKERAVYPLYKRKNLP